jgi:hypothetical protein
VETFAEEDYSNGITCAMETKKTRTEMLLATIISSCKPSYSFIPVQNKTSRVHVGTSNAPNKRLLSPDPGREAMNQDPETCNNMQD